MRKLALSLALICLFAPSALAAGGHYVRVAPRSVDPGASVRVYGSVDGGCAKGDAVTLFSTAFKGATKEEFAGVPALNAPVRKDHTFSTKVKLSGKLKPGTYQVGGRCGGGNFGSAKLKVKRG